MVTVQAWNILFRHSLLKLPTGARRKYSFFAFRKQAVQFNCAAISPLKI